MDMRFGHGDLWLPEINSTFNIELPQPDFFKKNASTQAECLHPLISEGATGMCGTTLDSDFAGKSSSNHLG